ncbi:MAG TPA: hypothetical protein VJS44_12995 [Pyrinomonadaceae bacterium]|nr:hypothetical protein [Pyrinomonadaceae bacterium]
MAVSRKWVPLVGIIGLVFSVIGIYSLIQSTDSESAATPKLTPTPTPTPITEVINAGKIFPMISVPAKSYDQKQSTFYNGQPTLERDKNGSEYLVVKGPSKLVYHFTLRKLTDNQDESIWIQVTFSSFDDRLEEVSDPDNGPIVRLKFWVNGKLAPDEIVRQIKAYGESGMSVTWAVNIRQFKVGDNTVTIEAEKANSKLAILSDLLIQLPEEAVSEQ